MKPLLTVLALTTALTLPTLASAREVTLTTTLRDYGGEKAFLVLYMTDAKGAYAGTLWLAASKARWYDSLSDWYRATGGNGAEITGITGASVGSGRTLTVTLDLADALIDAGYQIRIDTAVEHMYSNPSEIVVPLTAAGAGQPVAGRAVINSFSYTM